MELNWTTLVLEIVNFLVLVWILKRFLYRPVLRVIEERRAAIEGALGEAKERQEEAERLRVQYENRLAAWQQDKQAAREKLERELQQQRIRAMEELHKSLGDEREKASVVEQRRQSELEEVRQRAALELGTRFAARLLQGVSGPEVEGRIIDLVCTELGQLPEPQRAALRRAAENGGEQVRIESAHPLDDTQRARLREALRGLLGNETDCRFERQPALIAGLNLAFGDWSLDANVRDELKGFAERVHEPE